MTKTYKAGKTFMLKYKHHLTCIIVPFILIVILPCLPLLASSTCLLVFLLGLLFSSGLPPLISPILFLPGQVRFFLRYLKHS